MAASPETDALLLIGDSYSSPSPPSSPSPLPAQGNSSLTTKLDHTTPTSPPPPEQGTVEHSKSGEFPQPNDCGDLAPSLPPLGFGTPPSASPALEATSPEKPASPPPSCLPGALLEVLPDVVTASAGPHLHPPQIGKAPPVGEASPEDAPQPLSPPHTPPAKTSLRAASTTEVLTMAFPEAASPPPVSESDSHRGPALPPPPLGNGTKGNSSQVSENSEPTQPLPPQAGSTYVLSDAAVDEVVVVVSAEAAGSPPALEATDGERDAVPHVPPPLESWAEGELPQQQPRLPSSEMMPPRCQNSEPAELLQQPPSPAETTCSPAPLVSEEAAPVLDGTGGEPALESLSPGTLQEPIQTSSSTRMEAESCSPDMAPLGFENFKSKWLPQPAHTLLADTACMVPAGSLPSLETTDVGMNISPDQPPSSKSAEECPLHQPVKVTTFPTVEAAPCSPDIPPPGFENFKTSWLPQPTLPPSAVATYLPDVATMKEVLVEKACSVPTLDPTDMETDIERGLLPALESGAGGPLQVPKPNSHSPKTHPTPCSSNVAPPGFESSTLPQLQPPLPVYQNSHISQDSAAKGAVCLTSENAPQQSPILEAINATPGLPTSSESGVRESLQQEMSGSESLESLADAVITTVTVEAVGHPLTVAEVKEEAKGHILPPPLENGCDRPLPCLEPKVSSPVVQAAPRSPAITPTSFENLESSHQTSPRLSERTDSPSHLTVTECVTVQSEKMAQWVSPLLATDTDLESAPILQSPLKSEENSLPHPQHQASLPSGKDVPGSPDSAPPGYENLDDSKDLPPGVPLCPNFEMGQMVCGGCRELVAYPRGATHVQCFGCWTINLVLEAHQVGKVSCGQCETLLMYPSSAPAVRCSTCFFVTEIGAERTVHPRMSAERGTPPLPQELDQA